MKNITIRIFLVTVTSISSLAVTSQVDKIQGIYLDGAKVDSIYCNSFTTKETVFPLPKNANYSSFRIHEKIITTGDLKPLDMNQPDPGLAGDNKLWDSNDFYYDRDFSYQTMQNKYLKNGYIVFPGSHFDNNCFMYVKFYGLVFVAPAKSKKIKEMLEKKGVDYIDCTYDAILYGRRQTGVEETFDATCNCIKKTPVYENEHLSSINIKLKLRFIANDKEISTFAKDCKFKGSKLVDVLKNSNSSALADNGIKAILNNSSVVKPHSEKHKNGKIAVQGQLDANGQNEGTWKYFSETGKLERIENYKGGIMHGEWKYYDASGKLTKTEKYNEGELVE